MTEEGFRQRLNLGKGVTYGYSKEGKSGGISIWREAEAFVLTWMENHIEDQWDEDKYTINETHRFETVAQVEEFLLSKGIALTEFRPPRSGKRPTLA